METTLNAQEAQEALQQFCGTEYFYHYHLCNINWTDGVIFVAKNLAHWLITDISAQCKELEKKSEFIKVQLTSDNGKGTLEYTDGNGSLLHIHYYRRIDFVLDIISFYYTNRTLLLPSEY